MSGDGFEWSHGKPRPKSPRLLGNAEGVAPLPPAEESAPIKDPTTGRFVKGNQAHRRRQVKERAKGISTLNPERCASWMKPYVINGRDYAVDLLHRIGSDPVLARLAGDVADAHTCFRALIALAGTGDAEALREARHWLREHRSALVTLVKLAGEGGTSIDDDSHLYIDTKEATG